MKKILIVDDAQFIRKFTDSILSEKYETVCAASGPEAIELYEKEQPDMVLSDLVMPNMTGLQLQSLLQEKYGSQIPFMFMTADEREENESLGLAAGAMDYIRKPFKPEVLLRRVDNIMRQVDHMRQIQGLKQVAEKDPMTGLLNKACAQNTLAGLCGKAVGALMMVDLDSFKLVNDLFGHGMGDRVLIRFAEILRGVIRSSDVAGRMGGDEFILFCRDVREESTIADKSRVINECLTASAREFMGENHGIPLGASIGAVMVPDEGTAFADLYRKADKALYNVKQNGKHGYAVYRESTVRNETEKSSATAGLDSARMVLEERNRRKGAFELGFEDFRSVYRFLVRSLEHYHYQVDFVLLSLPDAEEKAAERFGEALRSTLRRSDVYTRHGKNQYMLLLPEVNDETAETILSRLLSRWAADGQYGSVAVKCEHEPVRPAP